MTDFTDIYEMATYLRDKLEGENYVLLFGYNSVGKTRLSTAFRDIGWQEERSRDTLYYNAYTEDLFTWHNYPIHINESVLLMNTES